jgi:hypothetical protein
LDFQPSHLSTPSPDRGYLDLTIITKYQHHRLNAFKKIGPQANSL